MGANAAACVMMRRKTDYVWDGERWQARALACDGPLQSSLRVPSALLHSPPFAATSYMACADAKVFCRRAFAWSRQTKRERAGSQA